MARQFLLFFCLLFCLLLGFCGCTQQKQIDAQEFYRRMHTIDAEKTLSADAGFRTKAESESLEHMEVPLTEKDVALLSLSINEAQAVCGVQWTLLPEDTQNETEAFKQLFTLYVQSIAVLQNQAPAQIEAMLSKEEFTQTALAFTPKQCLVDTKDGQYALLCQKDGIALYYFTSL